MSSELCENIVKIQCDRTLNATQCHCTAVGLYNYVIREPREHALSWNPCCNTLQHNAIGRFTARTGKTRPHIQPSGLVLENIASLIGLFCKRDL